MDEFETMRLHKVSGSPSWLDGVVQQDWGGVELDHGGYGNGENVAWYSPDEARRIGRALILAADYADEVVHG